MTKPARLLFIASLCQASKPFARPPLAALPAEVAEEVALAKAHDDDESILDVEVTVPEVSPELAAVIESTGEAQRMTPKRRIREEDGVLLTRAERRQVAAELEVARLAERRKWWLAAPLAPLWQTMRQA